ncbi:MAG: 23S rRNA (adenine(2030)-N(6))-methyltransferase RlmJ [Hyphomicrobiaceae bacterium]|nr:23S rRNA (adenine(2030)-N(6))-methyltransferase RlmJ [Hyphomicrobiaceae bacterium]
MTLINYLQTKDKPLFILDTHAGPGRYDLASPEAQKSGEYRHGIGRILGAAEVPEALKPYLDALRAENQGGGLTAYPGSPLLLARKLRPQDRLIACDLHPKEAEILAETLYPFPGARVRAGDGYAAVKALLPPPERRGLVLIDPPFEKTTEFADLAKALREAWKRFPVGVYLVWYPLKDRAAANALHADVVAAGMKDATTYELYVRDPAASPGMAGSGVLAINASYALDSVMRTAGPYLAKQLAQGPGARFTAARLTAE